MSVDPAYFDRLYAEDPDPWGFGSRWYERRKYALTLAALPHERYGRAFEPGCSIGVLTEQLADRCDELVAWEPHGPTRRRAAERLAARPHVVVEEASVPERWPDGGLDLLVVSEVAYYLDDDALARLAHRIEGSLRSGGDLVAVHYDGETDYPQTAATVHDALAGAVPADHLVHLAAAGFRLDVWRRR